MKLIIFLTLFYSYIPAQAELIGQPFEMSEKYQTGDEFMGIRLLGTLNLTGTPIKGFAAHELSGLAWSEDEQILYAISDKGYLLHLRPQFKDSHLDNIKLLDAYPLTDKAAKKIHKADAEGLDILYGNNGKKGDTSLLISFEIKPRIMRFTSTGEFLEDYKLPKAFNKIKDFQYKNAALESVIIHPDLGILTAPQLALKKADRNLRSIYDLNGKSWQYKPEDSKYSSVTDLEITPDRSVLILERRYANILAPIQSIIRRIKLSETDENNAQLPTETLALFESRKGWRLDNFEGIAHYKGNKYFIISDDNNSILQRTILVYFELIK